MAADVSYVPQNTIIAEQGLSQEWKNVCRLFDKCNITANRNGHSYKSKINFTRTDMSSICYSFSLYVSQLES